MPAYDALTGNPSNFKAPVPGNSGSSWFEDLGNSFMEHYTASTNDYLRGNYNAQQLLAGNPDPINQSLGTVGSDDSSLDVTGYDQAQWEYERQKELLDEQRAFNSAEAEKNRQWQERMSNTAYQRAVQDLEAEAPLPPVIANHLLSPAASKSCTAL